MKIARKLTVFLAKLLFILLVIVCLGLFFSLLVTVPLLALGLTQGSRSFIAVIVIMFLIFMFFVLLSLATYRLIKYLEKNNRDAYRGSGL